MGFDNDHLKKHNKRWHDDIGKNNKHIKWEQAGDAQSPFEVSKRKKAKILSGDLTLSQSIN